MWNKTRLKDLESVAFDEPTQLAYGKALLIVVRGDGEVSAGERDFILGMMASYGVPARVLEQLTTYAGHEDLESVMAPLVTDEKRAQNNRRTLVYNAIKACAADRSYHDGERASVRRLAARMGLSAELVAQLEELHEETERLTEKKRTLLGIRALEA